MIKENSYENKSRLPNKILGEVAKESGEKLSTILGRYYRNEPKTVNAVLKKLKEINEIRIENEKLKKELGVRLYGK